MPHLIACIVIFFLSFSLQAEEFRISLIKTAQSAGSPEAFVVKGGRWLHQRKLIHAALLIEHPQGKLLFDTGLGRSIDQAFANNSWWQRKLFAYEELNPAIDQLATQNIAVSDITAVIPSHLHWDHTGGLPDFNGVPVWVTEQGLDDALNHGHRPAYLPELLEETANWQSLKLSENNYRGFAHSLDIFNDGRLILVDLSGHTQGHLGLFVNLDSGRQLFFIGDTSWTAQGVKNNQPRPAFVHWINPVDLHPEQNNDMLNKIHHLTKVDPALLIVPAHDEVVAEKIARFPRYEN